LFPCKTHEDNEEEFLLFTQLTGYGKQFCEKNPLLGLYYTNIKPIEHVAYKIIFQLLGAFQTWHDQFGTPRIGTMSKIISNSIDHAMENVKLQLSKNFCCNARVVGNLILGSSYLKL
jgi:hypothetical protein